MRKVLFAAVASAMGRTVKFPVTSGGLSSSFEACRKDETTPPLPSDQAAMRRGPSMSPVRDQPPQPAPLTSGKESWPMKEVEGVWGRAMPKAKFVRAPKNRWNWIPVAWSVKGLVWAAEGDRRRARRRRRRVEVVEVWLGLTGFDRWAIASDGIFQVVVYMDRYVNGLLMSCY